MINQPFLTFSLIFIFSGFYFIGCTKKTDSVVKTHFSVIRSTLEGKLSWRGVVRSANRVELRADRKLVITKIHVRNLEIVKKGQLLFEMDQAENQQKRRDLDDTMKSLDLELRSARARFSNLSKTMLRKRLLLDKGIIARKEFEDVRRDELLGETDVKTKELEMQKNQRTKADLDKEAINSKVYSPMDGRISGLLATEGGFSPDVILGQLMGVVSDPDNLALWVEVDEGHIHDVGVGVPVTVVLDAFPGEVFPGKVLNVAAAQSNNSNAGASQIKTFEMSVSFQSRKLSVGEGFAGEVSLTYATKKDVLIVPLASVRYINGDDFVIAASSERDEGLPRQVKLGLKTENEAEVISGLTENEYIVVEDK